MTTKRTFDDNWPVALGLFVFVIALWAQSDALAGVFYDDGIYLVLAKSLAEGTGYAYLHLPGAPEAVHYPPLYPFVLGLFWRIWPEFPGNLTLFQLVDSLAFAASATIIARQVAKWGIPSWGKVVALTASFVSFPLLAIVSVRFSEPLFLLLLVCAISLADSEEVTLGHAVGAGVFAGLAALTRSLGMAAVIGIGISFMLRREHRLAVVSGLTGLAMTIPWVLWLQEHSGAIDSRLATVYGSYGDVVGLVGISSFFADADLRVFGPVARLLLPDWPGIIWWPLAAMLAGLTVYGAVRQFRCARALVITLALYSSVVTVWPYAPDRFVWIVLPWWFLLLGSGLHGMFQRGAGFSWLSVVILTVICAGFVPKEVASLREHRFSRAAEGISVPFGLLLPSVHRELSENAVIATGDEALVFLYTGRKAVPASLVSFDGREFVNLSPVESLSFYCDNGVTHIFNSGGDDPVADVIEGIEAIMPDALAEKFAIVHGPALYQLRC